jgi:two-component system cell cycle sensor histidine kinase/response regulator CckA
MENKKKRRRPNIIGRRQADAALAAIDVKFRSVIDSSPVPYALNDEKQNITYLNPAFVTTFGYDLKDIPTLADWWPKAYPDPEYRKWVATEWEAKLGKAKREGKKFEPMELSIQCNDGTVRIALVSAAALGEAYNGVHLVILYDITERKQGEDKRLNLERQIQNTQKLESLGVLAGGIAHDFNNLLTGIMGNISLAKTWMNPDDRAYQKLMEAEKASLRAAELSNQLLTFSKGGDPIKKPMQIPEFLENSVKFSLRGSNIVSEFVFEKYLWPVDIDEGQIGQVVQNLVINAQQAMPKGGKIRIKARNLTIKGNEKVEGLSLRNGSYVEISIKDQGLGIPQEILPKIFDPYFTTKPKGSGLGLAISHSIMQRHNGSISVRSKEGSGTTFCLFLPASPFATVPPNIGPEELVKGKGKVLVIDDEQAVLDAAVEMLRHLGYEVDSALSGTKALEKYIKGLDSGKPFNVVIADLTVPGDIGGIEVLRRIKEINSKVKVIVSSGYSNDPAMANFKSYGFSNVLTKPYRILDMSKTIKEVLDG